LSIHFAGQVMAANIVRFRQGGEVAWGVLEGERVIRVPGVFATTGEFVSRNDVGTLKQVREAGVARSEVEILSPITRIQQFICQGANYRRHMIESGMDPDAKTYNMIFTKAPSCIVAADSVLVKPAHVRFLDYEIELGLVLRRDIDRATVVTDANLIEFVAALVIVNDYSARDIQIPQMQFYKGKSYRTFGPVGPRLCMLEKGDAPEIRNLRLRLTVNGEVRQDDTTANLVFGPAETLTELSGVQDLFAGDLIATGTPAGCALSVPSPFRQKIAALLPEATKWRTFLAVQAARRQYLKTGDVVEATIVNASGTIDLGVQRNVVVEEGL